MIHRNDVRKMAVKGLLKVLFSIKATRKFEYVTRINFIGTLEVNKRPAATWSCSFKKNSWKTTKEEKSIVFLNWPFPSMLPDSQPEIHSLKMKSHCTLVVLHSSEQAGGTGAPSKSHFQNRVIILPLW